ncbi:hypothetical protein EVAR_29933_1 [Eumeta japonica]|uniref:Uncharacterized protein n=1 Tax=Eumeta variegata TaxID=151549 RepID=A0A4C1V7T1_EUMVA|nr:hypothetical protein EVAR_29933_1 [Eumeta japonica]
MGVRRDNKTQLSRAPAPRRSAGDRDKRSRALHSRIDQPNQMRQPQKTDLSCKDSQYTFRTAADSGTGAQLKCVICCSGAECSCRDLHKPTQFGVSACSCYEKDFLLVLRF